MKKILLSFLILVFSAAFVSATSAHSYNSQTGALTITLQKGWNMMSYVNVNSGTCADNTLKAAFFYSPVQNSYLGAYARGNYTLKDSGGDNTVYVPSNASEIINSEKASLYYHMQERTGGMFVYSTAYCSFEANIGSSANNQISEFPWTVKRGWNFLAMTPWMVGNNLNNIFADCSVSALNMWDEQNQKWYYESSTSAVSYLYQSTSELVDASVGNVLVVRLASDCKLRTGSGSPIVPPPLP